MWFAYLDESKQNNQFFVYSCLVVESDAWNDLFASVKQFRRHLRDKFGIYVGKEMHAWKFAAGKGRIANHPIPKNERAEIFAHAIRFIAECGHFLIISSANTNEFLAFDRLLNRVNRTAVARGKQVLLFCDKGQEAIFTRRIRRMRVFNHIWSNRGAWPEGEALRNIPIERIIEDPIFKDSKTSYFIQLADFCAYALLRSERPIASRTALGYHAMYDLLRPITLSINNRRDPRGLGIIR